MSKRSIPEFERAGFKDRFDVDDAGIDRVFGVFPAQKIRDIPPWMIVQGSIVVGSHKMMQIDVEPFIARN